MSTAGAVNDARKARVNMLPSLEIVTLKAECGNGANRPQNKVQSIAEDWVCEQIPQEHSATRAPSASSISFVRFFIRYRRQRKTFLVQPSQATKAASALTLSTHLTNPASFEQGAHCRRIFSIAFPFASSSISLSKKRTFCTNGSSISSTRIPHTVPLISALFG